jgi:threonylcarbamoyladenosine tRNA methylthiotransferase MtaB
MKVAFATLGCRVNQYESEAMTEKFIREGYEIVNFEEFSDVYVINTCTVTNMGDKKSRQIIGRARRTNKNAIIAVVGCYSQIAPEEVAAIDGVDVVLGTRNKGEAVYWVNRAMEEKKKIVQVSDVLKNNVFEDLKIEEYQDKTRAFLKIQDGCNRFCSYCLIPYARGAVCSKEAETVLEEVKELARNGFKEIILSGIHIASYGVDLKSGTTLVDVMEEIEKVDGIERIRIGSIDPTFFTEGIINRIKNLSKLCPHFHLSLQSGCDATLRRMNRRYSTEEYRTIVKELRSHIKDVSITTDIIVGFPGESEEEFKATYEFLRELKLAKLHIFKYSPRKGTRAAQMKDDVNGRVKEARSFKLMELNKINEREFVRGFLGREMEVLYEQKSSHRHNSYEGYTTNYIKVVTETIEGITEGKILRTRLTGTEDEHASGELVKN